MTGSGHGAGWDEIDLIECWIAELLEVLALLEWLAERCETDRARRYVAGLIETRGRRLQQLRRRRDDLRRAAGAGRHPTT